MLMATVSKLQATFATNELAAILFYKKVLRFIRSGHLSGWFLRLLEWVWDAVLVDF